MIAVDTNVLVRFADALRLASGRDAEGFATFDKSLLRKAGQVSSVNLIAPS
jgi:hypothetical protein